MKERTMLDFQKRIQWRRWLEAHGELEREARPFIIKKNAVGKNISYGAAVEDAICFGWMDGVVNEHDTEKFIIEFSPRKKDSARSSVNKVRAQRLMREGKMTQAGLERIEDAKREETREKRIREVVRRATEYKKPGVP